ncbi:MAG: MFS transporter [Patescibacteria group bacterium]
MSSRAPGTGRIAIYVSNLLVSFHYFLVIYITSTFLSAYVNAERLSLLYIIGSIVSVGLFSFFASAVQRIGNYRLILIYIALEALALLGLGFGRGHVVIAAFVLFIAVSPVIYLNLDIFLEKSIKDEGATGGIRGMFLSMQNITQVLCPFLVGFLLIANEYWRVYTISLAFLFAAVITIVGYLRKFDDARYHPRTLWQSALYVFKHQTLYHVVVAQFLLRFFYAWMVIYTPLYLSNYIGFTWPQIGTMFAIMLLPFLLLELPLGRMSDTKLPEKFIMIVGFLLMAGAVAVIPFLTAPSFVLWTAVLFVSRIGAACTEIATESYFFRHVDGALADTISLFRAARPATYIAAAIVASLALQAISLRWSFLILAVLMLWGLRYAFALTGRK